MAAKNKFLNAMKMPSIDDMFSSEADRQRESGDLVTEVPLSELHPFVGHPFEVRDDEDMRKLVDSIRENGVLTNLTVRRRAEGGYEIISGHRRDYCAKVVGLDTRPVIVRDYSDEDADILVVDYNINRENLLPSEKAKAYKLKLDAMKRQAGRPAKNGDQIGPHSLQGKSKEILAEQVKESTTQIQRFMNLNKLIPPLTEAVDAGKLKFVPAADYISHLTEKEQTYLQLVMERDEVSPSMDQAQRLKQISAEGKLETSIIDLIMREEKPLERKVTLRNDRLQKYFPPSYTPKQMEEVIVKLLEGWHRRRQQEQER